MFILYALLIGLVVGLLVGGRLSALGEIRFHWWPLIALGFLAQVALFSQPVSGWIGDAGPVIYVVTTLMVGAAVLRNLRLPGMPLIALGAASNMAAILANGGYMPSTPEALAAIGKGASTVYTNSSLPEHPALELLIDRFVLPSWLPMTNVFSIGDAILGLGVAVLVVVTMRRGARRSSPGPVASAEPVAPAAADAPVP